MHVIARITLCHHLRQKKMHEKALSGWLKAFRSDPLDKGNVASREAIASKMVAFSTSLNQKTTSPQVMRVS